MAVNPGDADADELPSMLWGLDLVFSAYSRLYITDILQMKESRQVPGNVSVKPSCNPWPLSFCFMVLSLNTIFKDNKNRLLQHFSKLSSKHL